MRVFGVVLGVVLLGECAASAPLTGSGLHEQNIAVSSTDKPSRVSRELTLAWDNQGRGGAALRQPGYVHVLGNGLGSNVLAEHSASAGYTSADNPFTGHPGTETASRAIEAYREIAKVKSYSLYELSRWERYCDRGVHMDERDWRFVQAEGAANIPTDAISACVPPTYTYQDYLVAWTRFCTAQITTDTERRIVRETSRPFSTVNPCNALN